MAPCYPAAEDQDDLRQTLETFTIGLQDALQSVVENALTTVMQDKHDKYYGGREHRRAATNTNSNDERLAESLFAALGQGNLHSLANPDVKYEHREHRRDGNRDAQQIVGRDGASSRWESNFKSDIPEFAGTLKPEEFIDWLNMVEEILEFKQVLDDMRVSLVATQFKHCASAWWTMLIDTRQREGKPHIDSWERLKKHMMRHFLPFNYERTLYKMLQILRQGSRNVDNYTAEFFELISSATLLETEDQLVSRFIGGLCNQLQLPMQQFNPTWFSKGHQRAIAIEH